jgi:hypothetical protein
VSAQAIAAAPAGIASAIGKRSEYAARLLAKAVKAGQIKLAPSVKGYYNQHSGQLLILALFVVPDQGLM